MISRKVKWRLEQKRYEIPIKLEASLRQQPYGNSKIVKFVTRKIVAKQCFSVMVAIVVCSVLKWYQFFTFWRFSGFHTFCLDPPLESIPKEQWFCYTCINSGSDFGFDEGEEHSLSSLQARDREFRKLWFESHPPPEAHSPPPEGDITKNRIGNVFVSEYDIEREFWRLVQSPTETVEIEYGADVHSTTHGR